MGEHHGTGAGLGTQFLTRHESPQIRADHGSTAKEASGTNNISVMLLLESFAPLPPADSDSEIARPGKIPETPWGLLCVVATCHGRFLLPFGGCIWVSPLGGAESVAAQRPYPS